MSAEDIIAIQQLIQREREGKDRAWWSEIERAYDPQAQIRVSWYHGPPNGFIEGSKKTAEKRLVKTTHALQPITVRVNGNRAVASLGCSIDNPHKASVFGAAAMLTVYCRLIYRAERRQSEWKLMSLDCIYQHDILQPIIPGETLTIDKAKLAKYRPSYPFLCYTLEYYGGTADPDLPGEGNETL